MDDESVMVPPIKIEVIFNWIETGVALAKDIDPISTLKQVEWTEHIISVMGEFDTRCENCHAIIDKTLAKLKEHFLAADEYRRVKQQKHGTLTKNLYATANAVQGPPSGHSFYEPPPYIAPTFDSRSAGYVTQDTLISTPTTRTEAQTEQITMLMCALATKSKTETGGRGESRGKNRRRQPTLYRDGELEYCFTHREIKNLMHTGKTCTKRCKGHLEKATLANKMGGSTKVFGLQV